MHAEKRFFQLLCMAFKNGREKKHSYKYIHENISDLLNKKKNAYEVKFNSYWNGLYKIFKNREKIYDPKNALLIIDNEMYTFYLAEGYPALYDRIIRELAYLHAIRNFEDRYHINNGYLRDKYSAPTLRGFNYKNYINYKVVISNNAFDLKTFLTDNERVLLTKIFYDYSIKPNFRMDRGEFARIIHLLGAKTDPHLFSGNLSKSKTYQYMDNKEFVPQKKNEILRSLEDKLAGKNVDMIRGEVQAILSNLR